jgi:hypothetical protein
MMLLNILPTAGGTMRRVTVAAVAAILFSANFPVLAHAADPLISQNTVGGPDVVSVMQVRNDKGSTTLSFQWDPRGQAGLLAIADVVSYSGLAPVIAVPDGWQLIRDDSDPQYTRQSLYWHVMEGDDPGTVTWTFSQPVRTQGAVILLDHAAWVSPIGMTSGNIAGSSVPSSKSVTTGQNGDLILSFYATDFGRTAGPKNAMGPGQVFPDNVNVVANQDSWYPFWILGAYQNLQGETGDVTCDGVQLATWVAAQVAINCR